MAIVPADESRAADDVVRIGPGNRQRAVDRRAGGQHHCIVKLAQFGNGDVFAHRDIADEADGIADRSLLVAPRNGLDRLVVGGDPGADQSEGYGEFVEHIDAGVLAPFLDRRFGRVIARRARPHDRDVPHVLLPQDGQSMHARPLAGKPMRATVNLR